MNTPPKKLISFVSGTFNEAENVEELFNRVCAIMSEHNNYDFEYIFIDNASTDGTVQRLKKIAQGDNRLKIIVNNRNFGHVRSPYWGVLQTSGDATIYLASDLQDPPELIAEFLKAWDGGAKVVLAVKPVSSINPFSHSLRKAYYTILDRISDVHLTRDATGFGLYDKEVVDEIRKINDPYPYIRGLVAELGYEIKTISFVQPRRTSGISKNNFYSLYDVAMLAIVSHSMVPIRIASIFGFILGFLSILCGTGIFIAKLIWWDKFVAGLAPVAVLLLFMFGVVLFFIGIIGEYVGSAHTYLQRRPIVVERERINFQK